jgi:hypothetical protein
MARSTLDISPRLLQTAGGVRYEFELRYSGGARREILFYEFAREHAPAPPRTFDGVLCAVVLHAMGERRDIRLRGPATRQMLRNLSEFQLAWSRWRPAVYRPIDITVDAVVDSGQVRPNRTSAAFSGGVDSTFTLLRNSPRSTNPSYTVDSVVLVHGFDVSLGNSNDLQELIDRTVPIRTLSGVDLRVMRTNSKDLRLQKWEESFVAQLAACLHLFSAEFSTALVASSEPYDALVLPWGSNPVTDHLLSGGDLTIVHDGAAFSRTDKIAFLSRVPAAVESLKVCWEGTQHGRNCGVCEKCIRTQLNFLAVGVTNPACFDAPLDPHRIPTISIRNDALLAEFASIIKYADAHRIDEEWLRLLRKRLRRGTRNWTVRDQARRSLARAGLLPIAARVNRVLTRRTRVS